MAQHLSTGMIQVIDNSTEQINDALRQILEQIDHLRGLRGRAQIHDETAVESPTLGSSAARLDNLQALVSDPADPFAAAQRFHASQDEQAFFGDLEETLLAALTARGGPTATQVYCAEGVETMNLYAALQQLGMV
jgi:hypothetical protein